MAGLGQGHVVSAGELKNRVDMRAAQRAENIREVQTLLRHDVVQQHLGRVVDLQKVEVALASLDDEALSQIADQSREVNDQLKAGLSTNTWILIAVIAGIVFVVLAVVVSIKDDI